MAESANQADALWSADYTRKVVNAIRPELRQMKMPWELVRFLNSRPCPVFSDSEEDCMKACWEGKRIIDCTDKLLDFIQSKENWFSMLKEALKSKDMLSPHVANALDTLKAQIDDANARQMASVGYPSESLLNRIIDDWTMQEEKDKKREEEVAALRADVHKLAGQLTQIASIIKSQFGDFAQDMVDARSSQVKMPRLEPSVTMTKLAARIEELSKTVDNLDVRLRKSESDIQEHNDHLNDFRNQVLDNMKDDEMKTELEKLAGDTAVITKKTNELAGEMQGLESKTVEQGVFFKAVLETKEALVLGTRLDESVRTYYNEGDGSWNKGKYTLPVNGNFLVSLTAVQEGEGEMELFVKCNYLATDTVVLTKKPGQTETCTRVVKFSKEDVLDVRVRKIESTPRIGYCCLTVYRIG